MFNIQDFFIDNGKIIWCVLIVIIFYAFMCLLPNENIALEWERAVGTVL